MNFLNKKAYSVVEYTVLFVIIMGAFLVMRNYIQRGVFSQWAQTGQSFAFGRQYDPQKTVECGFDDQSNMWYDRNCYESYAMTYCADGSTCIRRPQCTSGPCCVSGKPCGCQGDTNCEEGIMNSTCVVNNCSQLNNPAS
jgi:hypothetical protein